MIIGISGKRGAGKDTLTEMLETHFHFTRIGFADPMKRFLADAFEFSELQLHGPSEMREAVDPRFGRSPREMLQTLGTEWGRNLVHPDIWVMLAIRRARKLLAAGAPGVVVSDVRFVNELDALRVAGARLFRITRQSRAQSLHDAHASETALDQISNEDFHAVFANDGSFEMLREHLRQAMTRLTGVVR